MDFYDVSATKTLEKLNTSVSFGLSSKEASERLKKFGANEITKHKQKSIFGKIIEALKEPMLIILTFGFIIAFGSCLGEFLKTKKADFTECIGILFAIVLSVFITLFMEGSSERAFKALRRIYDDTAVNVIRDGTLIKISQRNVVAGDLVLLENGDKIVCDGRIVESLELKTDESALTGESEEVSKNYNVICPTNTTLAERYNMVYSGSFVVGGNGKMVVTATGDNTEFGKIAKELKKDDEMTPLKAKLGSLGKVISIIGLVASIIVFVACFIRLSLAGNLNFNSVRELFLSCVVLIIAAVPEGLPTIVAVSLALNMIKLASENALIKKMSATETAGAVSVICSDKTGTITQNKMTVERFFTPTGGVLPENVKNKYVLLNFACNTTVENTKNNKLLGSATEKALVLALNKNKNALSLSEYRRMYPVQDRVPFSSERKYSSATIKTENGLLELIKGAPEILAEKIKNAGLLSAIENEIKSEKNKARRVICFLHREIIEGENVSEYVYDGFVSIVDPIRPEVIKAVKVCKKAGVKIKILTGDSKETAYAVALELGILTGKESVALAKDLEGLSSENLKKALDKITVIARSTPLLKLRIVEALKEKGEVVAVTGDGINDAPALKKADVGFAMGITGTEIAKESADVVLLDDGFLSVVKAISFGRNVYLNIRRFITFQLTVNFSALIYVMVCVILGLETPFNTLELLWINLIMDGPPALTLGLSKTDDTLMNFAPIKRHESIVSKGMLLKIIFSSFFIGIVMLMQECSNFLGATLNEKRGASFTLFIFFQLFNAFNCTATGLDSLFLSLRKNKVMLITFLGVFFAHLIIVQTFGKIFMVSNLSFRLWLKTTFTALLIVVISELFKLILRKVLKKPQKKAF